jgi:hypothetical protein
MVVGAAEVAIVRATFLLALGRTHAGVHIQHSPHYGSAGMDVVDPAPGQIGQRGQVHLLGQHLGFEPTYLAGRGHILRYGPATYDPTQGRIMAWPSPICSRPEAGRPARGSALTSSTGSAGSTPSRTS